MGIEYQWLETNHVIPRNNDWSEVPMQYDSQKLRFDYNENGRKENVLT